MTWSLSASGHTPAADGGTGWKHAEEKLFAELQSVLSKPEYGASSSHFGGNHVQGNPHAAPEESTHEREVTGEDAQPGSALPGPAAAEPQQP